jgi:hypothetical protein
VTISKVQFIQNTVLCSDRYKQVTEALSWETWLVVELSPFFFKKTNMEVYMDTSPDHLHTTQNCIYISFDVRFLFKEYVYTV